MKSIHDRSLFVESIRHNITTEQTERLLNRRFFKSHLAFNALPFHRKWKYIYLTRDPRDVALSMFNQWENYSKLGDGRKLIRIAPPENFSEFWDEWIDTGQPFWSYWFDINSWWKARHLPNVMLIHYNNLIGNKAEAVQKIANFLDIEINPTQLEMILKYSSLEYMRENWQKFEARKLNNHQPTNCMVNQGTNGRWQNLLSALQLQNYEKMLSERVEPACADWIANGRTNFLSGCN